MKLFKSTIWAAVAVAAVAGFSACSDDNDYNAPAAPDGIYFPNDLPAEFEVQNTATSFEIEMYRLGSTAAKTYTLTAVYDSDILTIPSEITFPEGAKEANLTVTYNPAVMAQGKAFEFSVTIAESEASPAGNRVLESAVVITPPWSDWAPYSIDDREPYGTFNYSVGWYFQGSQPSIKTEWRYNTEDNTEFELHLLNWGEGEIADGLTFNVKGKNVDLPATNTGVDIEFTNGTFRLWVMDYNSYMLYRNPNAATDPASQGTFDAEKGLFRLRMVYAVDVNGEMYAQSEGWESFQMDGYPDYTFSCEYQGLTTNADATDSYATFMSTVADGITEAHFAISTTRSVDDLIAGLKAGTIADYAMLNAGEEQTFTLPLSGAGNYVLAGVAFDEEGQPVNQLSSDFSISTGISEWRKVGKATFLDGWITADFKFGSGDSARDYTNFPWEVEMIESIKEPGVYAMVAPYSSPDWVLNNEVNRPSGIFTKVNIIINCTDKDFVVVNPQYSGYTLKAGSVSDQPDPYVYYVANLAAIGMDEEGATKEQIIQSGNNDKLVGNEIRIAHPQFKQEENGEWYGWKDPNTHVVLTCDFLEANEDQKAGSKKAPALREGRVTGVNDFVTYRQHRRIFTLRTDL